ncbi:Flp family type IVb pilin [Zobellella iuensis]|uniref:Flp family type IVb pilin n=1 Tax=Zobellella iuensis TaxID=2803811 RepID=A0ABS1QQ24_9GAMM|nr:Flp family type IVb pilin [Zobellella iuensis]MBL1376607.1 Flp family type IVb pilin [Zobellella iuensis]
MNNTIVKGYVYLQMKISHFLQREDGASAIEYGIIAGLIAVGIIASVSDIGKELAGFFSSIKTNLDTATTPTTP